jgi:hypothetical protein
VIRGRVRDCLNEILRRPPRILSAGAIVWLITVSIAHSDTGVGLPAFFLSVFGGQALLAAWVVRGAAFLLARHHASLRSRAKTLWWAVVPMCLVAGATLSVLGSPPHNPLFALRFSLSERELTESAASLVSSDAQSLSERRIGLFLVSRIETGDRQVRFITASCGVVDSCGFVYSPSGAPRRWQEDRFVHLRGPWWHLYEGF